MTSEERAELETQLSEAKQAYHLLMTGRSVVSLQDQNGEKITYTNANAPRLAAYIAELKRQLGLNDGSGPMRAYFS